VIDERWPRLRKTILRGPLALVEAISIGMHAIRVATRETTGTDIPQSQFAALLAPVALGVLGVFVALPGIVTAGLDDTLADIIEAAGRAAMLLIYLGLLSRSAASKRLFGYHGAEHMAIAAFERHRRMPARDEVRAESPVHVRCGTDFIALLVMAAGVVFAFVPRDPLWLGGVLRVALFPLVAALAYEVLRLSARFSASPVARSITLPGRALQRITTRRPDDGQVEIAMAALRATVEP
jgi:uncharacterized protein YqhQ